MERIWKKTIGTLGFTLCMALAACSDYLDVSNEIAESLDLEAVFRNPAIHGNGTPIFLTVFPNIHVPAVTMPVGSPMSGRLFVVKR